MIMDMQKKRQAFEQLPEIAEILKRSQMVFNEDQNQYFIIGFASDTQKICDVNFVGGAWMAWQAAQARAVPEGLVELHLVWNENRDECVGFLDGGDAHYTATGNDGGAWGVTALGDYFRNLNDECDEFEAEVVMIKAQEQK